MPDLHSTINFLYNIFRAKFSLKDIESQFDRDTFLCLIGEEESTAALVSLFLGQKSGSPDARRPLLLSYPLREEDYTTIESYQCAIFVLKADPIQREELEALKGRLPSNLRVLWLLEGTPEPAQSIEKEDLICELNLGSVVWKKDLERDLPRALINLMPEMQLALAEDYPYLRDEVANRLIAQTSWQNLLIAFASALPTHIPIIGIILGALVITGDTVFLTANQLKLCLQIAGVYGKEIDFFQRVSELWPVLGGAFGWRTLARGLCGLIPGGGPVIKAVVAYAGTVVTGEVARRLYKEGKNLPPEQREEIFNTAKKWALERLEELIKGFKGKETKPGTERQKSSGTGMPVGEPSPDD